MIRQLRCLLPIAAAALVCGCAAPYQPVPDDYKGPTAYLADNVVREDSHKAQFFVIEEFDGHAINNAIYESRKASQGHGFSLDVRLVYRYLPAAPMKVKLIGTHETAAPIHAIASRAAGTFFSVEGVVDFVPKPGGNYMVNGELKKDGSSVWIEDAATHQPVTEKIRSRP